MGKINGWTKNVHTNALYRWDKGTTEIHINIMSADRRGKYLVEGSHSVGGYFGVGKTYAKTKAEAIACAMQYMRTH